MFIPRASRLVGLVAVGALLTMPSCAKKDDDDERDHQRAIDVAAAAPDGPRPACPVATTDHGCDALLPKDVMKLAAGGLVLPGAWFPLANGGSFVVGVRWGTQKLVTVKSSGGFEYDGSVDLSYEGSNGATGVTTSAERRLFFVALDEGLTTLRMSKVDENGIAAPVNVAFEGSAPLPLWPQAVALPDGRILLTYVGPWRDIVVGAGDGESRPFRMRDVPIPEATRMGMIAHVGLTRAGAWVLSYQATDDAFHFHAGVLVSTDEGVTWSAPIPLPSASDETLSDVFPIARPDQGADLYYARGAPAHESIRRRVLHEDGSLGPEQIVTAASVGRVEKPQPRRRGDGRITMLLTLDRSAATGTLAVAVLDGDAPL